jgi:hypothetical protein
MNYSLEIATEKTTAPKPSQSEHTLKRVSTICSIFDECRGMADASVERILGPQPVPAQEGDSIEGNPQNGFMNNLDADLARLERISGQLREALGHLVRAF